MNWSDMLHGTNVLPQNIAKKDVVKVKVKSKADHSIARAIYAAYLAKSADLKLHQEYAERVAKATDGPSMTPVMPLATMGCNGGALLCDHCGKAIILESGKFYNVPADVAWASVPEEQRSPRWLAYIKGGLMVRIVDNGTLRIYHGYDGVAGHCCTVAKAALDAAEAKHVQDNSNGTIIWKFLRDEFPEATDRDLDRKLSDIMNVMYSFDPGIGVNRP